MTSPTDNNLDLSALSREEAIDALQRIIDYITPIAHQNPKAAWLPYCPEEFKDDDNYDYDDIWEEAQKHGETYATHKIQAILNASLNQ